MWVAGIVAVLASLAIAPAAGAHAVLEESRPSNDSVVQVSPAQVTLRFSESIDTSPSAIRVYAADGARVDDGSIERPDANVASVGLEPRLADGTYTVTWRVVSADTHPVAGAFVFHVGAPGAQPGGIAEQLLQSSATSRTVSIAFTTIRFLSYALIFLCVGGMTGIALVLGRASEATRRRLLGLVAGFAGGLVVVSLVGIVLQAAEAAGVGILDAFRWRLIDEVLGTRFGQVWLARAVLGLLLAIGAIALRRARGRAAELTLDAALVVCAGLVLTPAAAGHSNGGAASFISDVVHVQAGAVWIGGLAFVLLALLFERTRRWELASDAVPRFSTIAVISVAALLVAGLVNAYLQVRSWSGLWETTYGRLILVKAGLLLPILALGAYNNRKEVPLLRRDIATPVEKRRFALTTAAELVLVVAVLAVTAVLVAEPPARTVTSPVGPYATTAAIGAFEANVVVDPAKTGPNQIHLYLTRKNGQPADVAEMTVVATLPSQGIGPLRFETRRLAPGHFVATGASLGFAGDWTLRLEGRQGEFTALVTTVTVPIGASDR